MLMRILLVFVLIALALPVCAEQVGIHHPQIKDGAKGLFIDGKAYVPIDVVNQIAPGTFAWDSAQKAIIKHGDNNHRVLFLGDKESPILTTLRSHDLKVDQSTQVPEALTAYAAIVLASESLYTPSLAARLVKYLQKGGGVVLMDGWPAHFNKSYQNGLLISHMESDSRWFGASQLRQQTDYAQGYAATDKPFSLGIDKGAGVWSMRNGEPMWLVLRSDLGGASIGVVDVSKAGYSPLDNGSECIDISMLSSGHAQWVFSFAHPYPPGKVYWQADVAPDYPKAVELFVGGVKWAAGIIKSVGGE